MSAIPEKTYWDILPKEPPRCSRCHQVLPFGGAFHSLVEMEARTMFGIKIIYDPDVPSDEIQMRDYQGRVVRVVKVAPSPAHRNG